MIQPLVIQTLTQKCTLIFTNILSNLSIFFSSINSNVTLINKSICLNYKCDNLITLITVLKKLVHLITFCCNEVTTGFK